MIAHHLSPARHMLDGTIRVFFAEALFPLTGLLTAAFLTRSLGPADFALFPLLSNSTDRRKLHQFEVAATAQPENARALRLAALPNGIAGIEGSAFFLGRSQNNREKEDGDKGQAL